jgi:hypothetical protein
MRKLYRYKRLNAPVQSSFLSRELLFAGLLRVNLVPPSSKRPPKLSNFVKGEVQALLSVSETPELRVLRSSGAAEERAPKLVHERGPSSGKVDRPATQYC